MTSTMSSMLLVKQLWSFIKDDFRCHCITGKGLRRRCERYIKALAMVAEYNPRRAQSEIFFEHYALGEFRVLRSNRGYKSDVLILIFLCISIFMLVFCEKWNII